MKALYVLSICFATLSTAALGFDEWLDRVDETLTVTAFEDRARLRLSGTIDLEGYYFDGPAFGVIDTTSNSLFNPRLTLFLDAQFGPKLYAFVQARADRGFDPSDGTMEGRLDEYALRYTPWEDGRISIQIGKFAAVIGNWMERHLSWDNPFINAPLPYDNVTPISDTIPPLYAHGFTHRYTAAGEKYEYNPVIWGPSYATGVSVAGRIGKFDYAAELKNAALSSRPESWDLTEVGFDHPTFNARVGYRPNQMWNLGFSASAGSYLRSEAEPFLPKGNDIGDYYQYLIGQDIGFAWHHLQIWAEFYEARFEVPNVGDADTFAYYLEAKYKFAPQFFGALRWNQQLFASVPDGYGGSAPWGRDLWRIDTALGYRFSAHTQLKFQYSFQHETSGSNDVDHMVAAQFTLRF